MMVLLRLYNNCKVNNICTFFAQRDNQQTVFGQKRYLARSLYIHILKTTQFSFVHHNSYQRAQIHLPCHTYMKRGKRSRYTFYPRYFSVGHTKRILDNSMQESDRDIIWSFIRDVKYISWQQEEIILQKLKVLAITFFAWANKLCPIKRLHAFPKKQKLNLRYKVRISVKIFCQMVLRLVKNIWHPYLLNTIPMLKIK